MGIVFFYKIYFVIGVISNIYDRRFLPKHKRAIYEIEKTLYFPFLYSITCVVELISLNYYLPCMVFKLLIILMMLLLIRRTSISLILALFVSGLFEVLFSIIEGRLLNFPLLLLLMVTSLIFLLFKKVEVKDYFQNLFLSLVILTSCLFLMFTKLTDALTYVSLYMILLVLLLILVHKSNLIERRLLLNTRNANIDSLTKAFNRRRFEIDLINLMKLSSRNMEELVLVAIDVDNFKAVNDTYGHLAGNSVLRAASKKLKNSIAAFNEDFEIYRVGGEEFNLLLPACSIDQASVVALECQKQVNQSITIAHGEKISITMSAGISNFKRGDTYSSFYKRADHNLYMSKVAGRNKITVNLKTMK